MSCLSCSNTNVPEDLCNGLDPCMGLCADIQRKMAFSSIARQFSTQSQYLFSLLILMYIYNGTILVLADGLIICTGQYILKSYSLKHVPFHSGRRAQFPDNDLILKLHYRNLHRMSPCHSLSIFPTSCGRDCYRDSNRGSSATEDGNYGSQDQTLIVSPCTTRCDNSLLKSSITSIRPQYHISQRYHPNAISPIFLKFRPDSNKTPSNRFFAICFDECFHLPSLSSSFLLETDNGSNESLDTISNQFTTNTHITVITNATPQLINIYN